MGLQHSEFMKRSYITNFLLKLMAMDKLPKEYIFELTLISMQSALYCESKKPAKRKNLENPAVNLP